MQALRAASILGSGFALADLASVTGRPAVDLSVALAEAIRAQVLEDDGPVLRFRHDLIRESIYAELPASVRRGLHREAGHRLAQAGAPSLQIAEHLSRGAAPGDAEAIRWLTKAAREAADRSPAVAADLLERATGLMDPKDPRRDQVLAIYERLQATRDLARTEAVLREAGVRRGRRAARGRPQAGWPSLTPAERAVAELVAEGLSNPQIGERL